MIKVVVVGGGISGLATAVKVQEKAKGLQESLELTVLEAENTLGGTIRTERIDGYQCESGPVGFLDNKPKTLELCETIGLSSQLLVSRDEARKRYVFSGGKLHLLPESPPAFLTFGLLSIRGRLRVLAEPWTRSAAVEDESIAEFARRHIGKEATAKLIDPMVTGIFAGNAEELSLKSCFPVMAVLEREGRGSLFRAMLRRLKKKRQLKKEGKTVRGGGTELGGGRLTSFTGGMGSIVTGLAKAIDGQVVTEARVSKVEGPDGDGRYGVSFSDGRDTIDADVVILAVPAHIGTNILEGFDGLLAKTLREIPYAPVTVVNTGYSEKSAGRSLEGFGFLIPSGEGRPILGSQWVSSIYQDQAPAGDVFVRTMVGGARRPDMAALDDEVLVSMVREELRALLGIADQPDFLKIYRYEKGIPQYTIGHPDRLTKLDEGLRQKPGFFLTGNAFRGIGVNDCVQNADVVSDQAIDYLGSRERR